MTRRAGRGGSRVVEVAAVQFAPRLGDVEANLERLAELVRGSSGGADLVVAPELASTGYDLELVDARGPELAEDADGPTVRLAQDLAAETGAVFVIGFLERDGDALYDAAVVAGPEGAPVRYRKSHLYPPERVRFDQGDRLMTVDAAPARLGVMICFEHAFPEIATTLALLGAEVLAIPSAVPCGYEHLLTLRSRARAQDNQVFVVAANLGGPQFCGGSLIVHPRGEVVATAGEGEEVLRASLDMDAIRREREQEPALRLRRPELYR